MVLAAGMSLLIALFMYILFASAKIKKVFIISK